MAIYTTILHKCFQSHYITLHYVTFVSLIDCMQTTTLARMTHVTIQRWNSELLIGIIWYSDFSLVSD